MVYQLIPVMEPLTRKDIGLALIFSESQNKVPPWFLREVCSSILG